MGNTRSNNCGIELVIASTMFVSEAAAAGNGNSSGSGNGKDNSSCSDRVKSSKNTGSNSSD